MLRVFRELASSICWRGGGFYICKTTQKIYIKCYCLGTLGGQGRSPEGPRGLAPLPDDSIRNLTPLLSACLFPSLALLSSSSLSNRRKTAASLASCLLNHSHMKRMGSPGGISSKEPACQRRRRKRQRFSPWWERPPGGGHGNPLQRSCLEHPMDRGAWRATVHGVAKSWTRQK